MLIGMSQAVSVRALAAVSAVTLLLHGPSRIANGHLLTSLCNPYGSARCEGHVI